MIGNEPPSANLVAALRSHSIAVPNGAYLGSEAELRLRLGVSGPRLRRAARLLEQEQLLSVERGHVGGYFARRPTAGATTRAAALYLALRKTPISQVRYTAAPLMVETARLAAQASASQGSDALQGLLGGLSGLQDGQDIHQLLTAERRLSGELIRMASNPALTLFLRVSYRLGRLYDQRAQLFEAQPQHAKLWRDEALALARAIIDGDPDLAVLIARRKELMLERWLARFELERPPRGMDIDDLWRPPREHATEIDVTAEQLRRLCLSTSEGEGLGSLTGLARRFGVTAHKLRQAATLVQHQGLLAIKRGPKGGYVSARPDINHVVTAVANYLDVNACSLPKLLIASNCLGMEACRLAADSRDRAARENLRATLAAFDPSVLNESGPEAVPGLLKAERRFMFALLHMADSAPIELFVKSMYRYSGMIHLPINDHPEWIGGWAKTRLRVADAILAGDGAAAGVISARITARLERWSA